MDTKPKGKRLHRMIRLVAEERAARQRQQLQTLSDQDLEELDHELKKTRHKRRMRRRQGILEMPYRSVLKVLTAHYIQPQPKSAKDCGNYMLMPSKLPKEPIVYSAGVGGNISFDEAIAKKHSAKVFMFDPTPRSIAFMEKRGKKKGLSFYPWAVFTRDGALDMYFDHATSLGKVSNASATNIVGTSQKFRSQAYTVSTLMHKLGHQSIDVLKLDIEGAAPQVIVQTLKSGVFPTQILCEFERPVGFHRVREQSMYLLDVRRALSALREAKYDVYKIRHSRFDRQLEVLAVRS